MDVKRLARDRVDDGQLGDSVATCSTTPRLFYDPEIYLVMFGR